MGELESLGAIYWSQAWLDALRDAGLDADMLAQGETYAKHDWGLEIFIDKGRAEATAGTGRRLSYEVAVTLPVLEDDVWTQILQRVANSSGRTAALLDNSLDPAILEDARAADSSLLPRSGELSWSCGCHDIVRSVGMCKHVGAVLYLLADSFDEDPFELLLLRGRNRDELRSAVSELRTGFADEPDLDEVAEQAWSRTPGPLPAVPRGDDEPGELTAWGTDPPPNAPFSADGLRAIGSDSAWRAWRIATKAEDDAHLELDLASDLARRAALIERTKGWRGLVRNSGLTSQELASRAQAWRVAGTDGVRIHLHHQISRKVSPTAQVRQADDDRWFRFEKTSGRWTVTAGPVDDPESLLSTVDITDGDNSGRVER